MRINRKGGGSEKMRSRRRRNRKEALTSGTV